MKQIILTLIISLILITLLSGGATGFAAESIITNGGKEIEPDSHENRLPNT